MQNVVRQSHKLTNKKPKDTYKDMRQLARHFVLMVFVSSLVTIVFLCVTSSMTSLVGFDVVSSSRIEQTKLDRTRRNNLIDHNIKEDVEFPFINRTIYSVPDCACEREGFELSSLREAQQLARLHPDRYTSSFLARYGFEGESTCSDYSTQRGAGQNVVTYSYFDPSGRVRLYGENFAKYLFGLHERAATIRLKYPGWIMRIYHNIMESDKAGNRFMCHLFCDHPHVDLCQVHHLPTLGNLTQPPVAGRMWRFAVLGDPTVATFLSRDTDSYILDTEVVVVKEWLESDKDFHVIRDYVKHKPYILAGLWGGRNTDMNLTRYLRDTMFAEKMKTRKNQDQELLRYVVWPKIKHTLLQHDSFSCQREGRQDARPFPVKRIGGFYCGYGPFKHKVYKKAATLICPKKCRPQNHMDWIHC